MRYALRLNLFLSMIKKTMSFWSWCFLSVKLRSESLCGVQYKN